jgi:hypothetical protein
MIKAAIGPEAYALVGTIGKAGYKAWGCTWNDGGFCQSAVSRIM